MQLILKNYQNQSKLSQITLGALFATILVVLFLIGRYVPIFGTIATFFCPIPLILMHVQFKNIKNTIMVALVACVLIALITGSIISATFFLIGIGVQGIALALLISYNKNAAEVIVISAICITISAAFLFLISTFLFTEGKITFKKQFDLIADSFKKKANSSIESLKKSGASLEQIKNLEKQYEQLEQSIRNMYLYAPLFIFGSALISAFINYQVAKYILQKMNYFIKPLPNFKTWSLHWRYFWMFILGLILINLTHQNIEHSKLFYWLNLIGNNITFAFFIVFFIIGLSVTHFYMEKYELSFIFKVFLYFLIFLNPIFYTAILVIGFLDPWFNIRNLVNTSSIVENNLIDS